MFSGMFRWRFARKLFLSHGHVCQRLLELCRFVFLLRSIVQVQVAILFEVQVRFVCVLAAPDTIFNVSVSGGSFWLGSGTGFAGDIIFQIYVIFVACTRML